MESVATRTQASPSPSLAKIDPSVVGIWALAGGLVLYLAVDGGGYGTVVHSQVGMLVWWVVLVGTAVGLLPVARLSRVGWASVGLFGAFVAWTALGATWSVSLGRSLADLSLVAGYLGVLVLGVWMHRDRDRALRHTLAALATAIMVVVGLALLSRLRPGLFPGAEQTASFLPGTSRRLSWPLNYWNALAALLAFSLPLLLALATSARTLYGQAAAAAGIPLVVLCGYLTLSRGGALAGAVALVVFVALAPTRLPKLATIVVTGAGGAALVAGAVHRSAIEQGLVTAAARHQGATLLLPIVLVCVGVAVAQVGIGLAVRHATPPRLLVIPPRRARWLLAGGAVAFVVVALAAGAPTKLSHAWRDFKNPASAALKQSSLSRFGTVSGNGRYELWRAAVNATSGHVLKGSGPGTYQLLWLPRAVPGVNYVQNAHSLYFETLAEEGVVGLALLVGFLAVVAGAAIALVVRSRFEARARAAGAAAAMIAFIVSAASDWIWQVPALPVAFLVLAAAVVAPRRRRRRIGLVPRWMLRVGASLVAIACLVAIGVPLATANKIKASQDAASRGDPALALRDAQGAANVEPGAASPQVQLALVEEQQGNVRGALAAANRAAHDEPANWSTWLIIARLDAENRRPVASLAAFRRARSLNPHSPVFISVRRPKHRR
ncbi:MAG TPA: O-antigen ligase family protein [Solirubrobacteraceae bacterium]|jgi:O-antigen ligase